MVEISNLQKQLFIILVQCNGQQEANGRSTTVAGRQIKMPNILAFSSKNGQRLIALLEEILEKKIFTCKMLDFWSKQFDHDIANLEMRVIMHLSKGFS